MKERLAIILFLLIGGLQSFALPNMIVEHYTAEDGLPNNTVYCTLKDSDGFVWLGTWYGLCRFDGVKFHSYNNPQDGYSLDIPPRKIQHIVEDRNGFLWIKTIDHKLYLFDKRREKFHAVYDDVKEYTENTQIIKIQATDDGAVLLLAKDKNLLRACTDADGKIVMTRLHDSQPNANSYDMRLRHNVFCETADYINWIGMDYKILSLKKGEALKNKPANFISQKISADSDRFTCLSHSAHFLWLGDKDGCVYSIDPQNGVVHRYEMPSLQQPILSLMVTEGGVMYLATDQGAYEYHISYKQLRQLPFTVSGAEVGTIFADQYEKIWFQEGNKALIYYDPLNKSHRRFDFPGQNAMVEFSVHDAGIQGIFFQTPGGEVLLYDREKQQMIRLNQLKSFADDFPDQRFLHLMLDKDGILWLSCTENGVFRVNFPKKQFQMMEEVLVASAPQGKDAAPTKQGIRALFQAKNGDIWVGTRWLGLYRLDAYGRVKQVFDERTYQVGAVYHIMEDKDGNLWFSTKGDGLVKAEADIRSPHGLRFTRYKNNPKDPNSISGNGVYFTYQDSHDRIWVGLLGGGLNLISEENGDVLFRHKYNGLEQYPGYGLYMQVRTMVEDNEGRIWIGTMDGLMSFDSDFTTPEQIRFETYRQASEYSNVAENDIYALYKDTDSQIWVSVFGGGLNCMVDYDEAHHVPVFQSYGIDEGLNNDVVKSIVEDENGNLWFATEIGLSCLNKQTGQFRNYDEYEGFTSVELEEGSAIRTLDGDLWMGTRQGILRFSPDRLETLKTDYATYIVDFKVSNRDLRSFVDPPILDQSITYADAITLRHHQSMFAIEFAALNFYNQNRVSYRYILDGYEDDWHYSGKNRIASYTNVPPGEYTFRVEAMDETNPDLVSSRALMVTVLPPWWQTWWAIAIYILLGLIVLYFALRLASFTLKMKNDVYIEQKVSEMKIRFFTNISHELRTPLALIKGPIQELKEHEDLSPKGLQYIDLMEKNTNQMLQLVNQILDFRKIQNGKMRLHVSQFDLSQLLRAFQKEFCIISEENEIHFTFDLPDSPLLIWADKDKLGVVIRNILSNAFKFTPSGGDIQVTAGLTEDGKRCFVRVKDSGMGIPPGKQTEIFERFSRGGNTQNVQGTGIGLALSKEIVSLHQGEIRAESPEGGGAAFTVELQLGKDHFSPTEVDFYVDDAVDLPEESEKETTSESDTEEEHETDASLPTLLLVEDNKDLCQLMKLQLENKFNVDIANNGVEGLKKVHLYHPDIVVTDQMMPEMDGLEMLQAIRKDFQISHIPVIILTAKTDEDAKTKAIVLGANAYITKPFSKEYLLARIEQLLGERKQFRERIRQQMKEESTEAADTDNYGQYLVKKDVQFIEKVRQVIEENMDDSEFNIDTIASTMGLSRSSFFKKLKSLTGLAPVDLVKEVRLNKSLELIKNTDMTISEIAFAVGFKDSGYYSKCFRKKYNQTPREYINEYRKGARN